MGKSMVRPQWHVLGRLAARLFSLFMGSMMLFAAQTARAAGAEDVPLPTFGDQEMWIIRIVLGAGIVSVITGFIWYRSVASQSPGTERMQEVGQAIRDGALAYLRQQVRTMAVLVFVISIGLFLLYRYAMGTSLNESIGVAIFFVLGVTASYLAGYVGMLMATIANQRTANQARTTFKGALETAFRAGAVSGMMTVGLGLIGACIVFLVYRERAMLILIGFGFGGSLAALFMRVGGGIFTKAADVGADLVGKIEAGIPEDDPRNPATIADNVGDNVGDCAGMAADVFESYEVTLVAAIILGATIIPQAAWSTDPQARSSALALIMYPLIVRAVGVIASIIGVLCVKGADRDDLDPMQPINMGFRISAFVATLLFGVGAYWYFGVAHKGVWIPSATGTVEYGWWRFFLCTFIGIVLAMVIGWLTEYFTSTDKKPVTEIAYNSRTGPATMIISGFSYGLESSVWSVVAISVTLLFALAIFPGNALLAAYGIALAGLGLLTTTGYILAMDTFGPITDNANGIFEMSGVLEEDRAAGRGVQPGALSGDRIVGRLDAVGNTTKALTKGFAIATAVIAAVALFRSFMTGAHLLPPEGAALASAITNGQIFGIPLDVPEVFIGLLIGGAAPFLFSSFAINAVGRAAVLLIEEVRRQFREDKGIMLGTSKPDYARCVAISTAAAQKELLGPGILAIGLPILVGFGLGFRRPDVGAAALGGYLAGAIVSGQLMAVLLSNSGGAWDNAKKKIEDGLFGGKGTENHKAAVICDTVGDPFKDTAGPALNPLIKVMNLTGILIAGIVIQPISFTARMSVVLISGLALAGAIAFSKRGSIVDLETEGQLPGPETVPSGSSGH